MSTTDLTQKHRHGLSATDARFDAQALRLAALETKIAELALEVANHTHDETPPPEPPPAGSWWGLADPWASIPFGSRPLAPAGPLWLNAGQRITNMTFENRPAGQNVIVVENAANCIIEGCDFDSVPEGIYAFNSPGLQIRNCRVGGAGIFGPFKRTGFHSGNLAQIVNSKGVRGSDIQIIQPSTIPASSPVPAADWGTEDVFSLGGDRGAWGDHIFERVYIDAGPWKSWSGTGFFVGDGGSGYDVTIRKFKMMSPGQCAIGTGEEGPYTFQDGDIKSTRGDTNACLQIRSNQTRIGNVRVDWGHGAPYAFGGEPVAATTFVDLGGNVWDASL